MHFLPSFCLLSSSTFRWCCFSPHAVGWCYLSLSLLWWWCFSLPSFCLMLPCSSILRWWCFTFPILPGLEFPATGHGTAILSQVFGPNNWSRSQPFEGEKSKILSWEWSITAAVRANIADELRRVEKQCEAGLQKIAFERRTESCRGHVVLFTGTALQGWNRIVRLKADDENGLQAWQALWQKTSETQMSLMNQFQNSHISSSDPRVNLREWRENPKGPQRRSGKVSTSTMWHVWTCVNMRRDCPPRKRFVMSMRNIVKPRRIAIER